MNKIEKKSGIIAGVSLIIMAITAGFSYGYVHSLLIGESAEMTMQNLIDNKGLFIMGILGWIIIFITDLIVALALYRVFKSTSKVPSQITAGIRILYTLGLGFAIFHLIAIIPNIGVEGSDLEIMSRFNKFQNIWSSALVIFGLHLLGLGYLSIKSKFIPAILGILLYIAGLSYTFIPVLKQITSLDQGLIARAETILSIPMALGEILLAILLIYLGFKKNKAS